MDKIGLKSKDLCNLVILLYAIAGVIIPIFFKDCVEAYSTAALSTSPFILTWIGSIFGGNLTKAKFGLSDVQNVVGEIGKMRPIAPTDVATVEQKKSEQVPNLRGKEENLNAISSIND